MSAEGGELISSSLVILFIILNLFIGAILKYLSSNLKLPYTPILLLWGILIGAKSESMHIFGDSVAKVNEINPHAILFIFLPALVFESAFSMNWHTFRRQIIQILLLAFPGVVISSLLAAISIKYIMNYDEFSFLHAWLFGSILAATDPIAVVSLLKELGAPKTLSTLIDGESILNDGSAIVLFEVLFDIATETREAAAGPIIKLFCSLSLGGPVMGIAFGIGISLILERIHNKPVLEVCLIFVSGYLLFFTCEDLEIHFSGVLAVLSYGLFMSIYGKTKISPTSEEAVHSFWQFACFAAETLIFVLTGSIIGLKFRNIDIEPLDWGMLFVFYILMNLSRGIMVMCFYPFFKYLGYGFDWKQALVLIFGGLRGAVALAMALKIALDEYFHDIPYVKDKIMFFSAGFICLTLFINATLSPFLIKKLEIVKEKNSQINLYNQILLQMEDHTNKIINEKLKKSKFLKFANWNEVKTEIFNKIYDQAKNKYMKSNENNIKTEEKLEIEEIDTEELLEARFRYLKILKTLYWKYLMNGFCSGYVTVYLMDSVDTSLDNLKEEINDWFFVQKYILNNYFDRILYKISSIKFLNRFTKNFIVQKQIKNYDAVTNYIKAHISAQEKLRDCNFRKETQEKIDYEIEKNIKYAKKYLNEDFYKTSYLLALNIQNYKAAQISLNLQIDYVNENYEKGLLTEKEHSFLMETLQKNQINLRISIPKEEEETLFLSSFIFDLDFFKFGFQPEIFDEILKQKKIESFKIDENIFKINQAIDSVFVVIKGAVLEKSHYHQRSFEYGGIINIRYILNPKNANTECYSISDTVLAKIPIKIIEENVSIQAMEDIYRNEIIELIKIFPQNFPILSQMSSIKLKKIIKECSFERCKRGESSKFNNGIILLSGGAVPIKNKINENMIVDLEEIPMHSFYKDKEDGFGVHFTQNSSLFVFTSNANQLYEIYKRETKFFAKNQFKNKDIIELTSMRLREDSNQKKNIKMGSIREYNHELPGNEEEEEEKIDTFIPHGMSRFSVF